MNKKNKDINFWSNYWTGMANAYENPITAVGYTELGDTISNNTFNEIIQDIINKIDLREYDKLLDVGCGNGIVLSKLNDVISDFKGVDLSSGMIDNAISYLGDNFYIAEAIDLPFNNNSFNKILCYSVFHYFPNYIYARRAITEIIRVLKPQGKILIGDIPLKCKKNIYLDYKGINNIKRLLFYIKEFLSNISTYNFIPTHLWYKKEFFEETLSNIDGVKYKFLDQNNINSRETAILGIRFDVLIEKV